MLKSRAEDEVVNGNRLRVVCKQLVHGCIDLLLSTCQRTVIVWITCEAGQWASSIVVVFSGDRYDVVVVVVFLVVEGGALVVDRPHLLLSSINRR